LTCGVENHTPFIFGLYMLATLICSSHVPQIFKYDF
jgi:hypothetical protein